eukprot:TRINITY_DN4780_c0_g1_i1.p1 TRINITY_DN4780_c0_g1~~TRINITY_DN4780_c0_g1_i1.p1  ORF type:complete len:186 (+),score=32.76 TRINITY_DN4780_c0_g1_i1:613-1170(+)
MPPRVEVRVVTTDTVSIQFHGIDEYDQLKYISRLYKNHFEHDHFDTLWSAVTRLEIQGFAFEKPQVSKRQDLLRDLGEFTSGLRLKITETDFGRHLFLTPVSLHRHSDTPEFGHSDSLFKMGIVPRKQNNEIETRIFCGFHISKSESVLLKADDIVIISVVLTHKKDTDGIVGEQVETFEFQLEK